MRRLPVFLILLCSCGTPISEEKPISPEALEADPKRSDGASARASELGKQVEQELSGLDADDWAGRYYFGDGLGVNVSLDIAPKAGFVFEWHGCMGLYDRNYGQVKEVDNEIHLAFELENKQEGFQGLSPAFLPVKWGERMYLIPADEVAEFCNAINYGDEPRRSARGSFLLREGDHEKKAEGTPALPEKYRPYLLIQPIESRIVKIGETSLRPSRVDWNFKDTVVVLNAGKKHGVFKGMKFHVHRPEDKFESAIVVSVAEDSCEAVMTQIGEEDSLPKTGWELSTASKWKDYKEVDEKSTQQTKPPDKQ